MKFLLALAKPFLVYMDILTKKIAFPLLTINMQSEFFFFISLRNPYNKGKETLDKMSNAWQANNK